MEISSACSILSLPSSDASLNCGNDENDLRQGSSYGVVVPLSLWCVQKQQLEFLRVITL